MYTRDILPPVNSPIKDGNPLTGTWNRAFEKVDLMEIRNPYRNYMPRWARNIRNKEWQTFTAQDDNYVFEAVFSNLKLYRMAYILFYDKNSGEKFFYRKIKPGTGWQLPLSLANTSIDSHIGGFYFRIHSWLDADTIKLDINIEAAGKKPSLTAHLAYNVSSQDVTPIAVSMGMSDRRIIYAYKTLAPVRADMVFGGRHISLKQDTCSGFFCDYKGFFPYNLHTTYCSAMGFDANRRFGFHIAENQTREPNKNNENALWVNGKLTPLPPVIITMPNGVDDSWVIQDVEGMIDLTFTPKEMTKSGLKFLLTNAEFNSPVGYYNGMVADSSGEQIQIKNLFGIGEKINLRV